MKKTHHFMALYDFTKLFVKQVRQGMHANAVQKCIHMQWKNMSDAKPNRKTKKSENLIEVERLVKSLVFEKRTGRLKHNKV